MMYVYNVITCNNAANDMAFTVCSFNMLLPTLDTFFMALHRQTVEVAVPLLEQAVHLGTLQRSSQSDSIQIQTKSRCVPFMTAVK